MMDLLIYSSCIYICIYKNTQFCFLSHKHVQSTPILIICGSINLKHIRIRRSLILLIFCMLMELYTFNFVAAYKNDIIRIYLY